MKRSLAALLLFTILLSCNETDKKEPVSTDGKTYDLHMRLAKGDNFGYDMVTEMSMDLMDMKMTATVAADITVTDSTAQGKQLKISYTKMKTTTKSGVLGNDFDSIANRSTNDITGHSVTAILEGNKVIEVSGLDTTAKKITDAQNRELVKKLYSKESLNNFFGMLFNMYPKEPVKTGDSWNADNKMDIGGMITNFAAKYTLMNVKDGIAEIAMEGTVSSDGGVKQEGQKIDLEMKGTQKGSFFIKLADGYLRDGTFDGDVEATINMGSQKMPIKGKVKAVVKGK